MAGFEVNKASMPGKANQDGQLIEDVQSSEGALPFSGSSSSRRRGYIPCRQKVPEWFYSPIGPSATSGICSELERTSGNVSVDTSPNRMQIIHHQNANEFNTGKTPFTNNEYARRGHAVRGPGRSKRQQTPVQCGPSQPMPYHGIRPLLEAGYPRFTYAQPAPSHQEQTIREPVGGKVVESQRLKFYEFRLLELALFKAKAEKRHKELLVDTHSKPGEIVFQGFVQDVHQERERMNSLLQNVKSRTVTDITPWQRKILENRKISHFFMKKFRNENVIAALDHERVVMVHALKDCDLEKAMSVIKGNIVQQTLHFSLESSHLLSSQDWQDLVHQQEKKYSEMLTIAPDLKNQQIIITGVKDIIQDVVGALQSFLDGNTAYTELFCFSPSRQKFVSLYMKDKVKSIADLFRAYNVQIAFINDGKEISIRGTGKGLELLKQKLQEFANEKVICHVETYTDQTKIKFLNSETCAKDLDALGLQHGCVLALTEETEGIQIVLESSRGKTGNTGPVSGSKCAHSSVYPTSTVQHDVTSNALSPFYSCVDYTQGMVLSTGSMCVFEIYDIPVCVIVKQGDITEEHIDAIVNSTNSSLDLNRGQVSKTLKRKCGEILETECKFVNIRESGVAVTSAHNLNCKRIIHVDASKFRLSWDDCVEAVLMESERLHLQSLAIPAFGTGSYGRTAAESAGDMFFGLRRFLKGKNPILQELRIVLYDVNKMSSFVDTFKRIADMTDPRCKIEYMVAEFPRQIEQITLAPHNESKLYIYADNQTTVQKALKAFDNLVAEKITMREIKDEMIGKLKEQQLQKIRQIGKHHDVNAIIQQSLKVIYVEGTRQNVSAAVQEINQMLLQASGTMALPENWSPHDLAEKMKRIKLQPNDKEYGKVEWSLIQTLDQQISIVCVERIQNPTQYRQYQLKKVQMEKDNPGIMNEKTLWHGTADTAIDSINTHGFNRSYCGKNATAYGQGVYFAVNSSYSLNRKYSPPDNSGKRYLYQCKVLVGYPVKGHMQLKVLPERKGNILYDSAADDVSNPSMYVIFNDTQAYPEYLITFC